MKSITSQNHQPSTGNWAVRCICARIYPRRSVPSSRRRAGTRRQTARSAIINLSKYKYIRFWTKHARSQSPSKEKKTFKSTCFTNNVLPRGRPEHLNWFHLLPIPVPNSYRILWRRPVSLHKFQQLCAGRIIPDQVRVLRIAVQRF